MIEWLEKSPLFPKFFWKNRKCETVVALCGKRKEYFTFPKMVKSPVFGAKTFLPFASDDLLWKNFPPCYFFEPLEQKRAHLSSIRRSDQFLELSQRDDLPDHNRWKENVIKTKKCIAVGILRKAVLARVSTFTFEDRINPWELLRCLLHTTHNSTVFAFQFTPRSLFFGASPEKLYERIGNLLTTESLAGTRHLSAPDKELLHSKKDQEEFTIVKEALTEILTPYSSNLHWQPKDTLIKTTAVKHLYNQLKCRLKEKMSDVTLIHAIHPTPAMGGFPKEQALKWIQKIEPFSRGFYAAPIGWMDDKNADFAVGIRSALVCENQLHLFTGAGIVADSDPQKEWDEIETKMRPFTDELCQTYH